jgi:hypothetical protein
VHAFLTYLRVFFACYFSAMGYPEWCVNALHGFGVNLFDGHFDAKVVRGNSMSEVH